MGADRATAAISKMRTDIQKVSWDLRQGHCWL